MGKASWILVVEDTPSNSELVSDLLELHGYQVDVVPHAADAFRRLGEGRPDLIIMDVQLPEIDGLEATRRLKGNPATRHIPVVALTAYGMPGDRERALAAGCAGYITKPIDKAAFLREVAAHLPRDEQRATS